MLKAILTTLGGLIALLVLWLKRWESPEKKRERQYEEFQKKRQDILNGNSDAVSSRIDRLLSSEGNNPSGESDDKA